MMLKVMVNVRFSYNHMLCNFTSSPPRFETPDPAYYLYTTSQGALSGRRVLIDILRLLAFTYGAAPLIIHVVLTVPCNKMYM